MRTWIHRHYGAVSTAILALMLLLIGLNLWKYGYLDGVMSGNKDAVAVADTVLKSVLLVLGAVLSYFRFFYGRTLSRRADLTITASAIEIPSGSFLHAIGLNVKNVGTVTIWSPVPSLEVRTHERNAEAKSLVETNLVRDAGYGEQGRGVDIIEPGETVPYMFLVCVPSTAWAVTVVASLECDRDDKWFAYAALPNAARPTSK